MLAHQVIHILQDVAVHVVEAKPEEVVAQRSQVCGMGQAVKAAEGDKEVAFVGNAVVELYFGFIQGHDIALHFGKSVHGFFPGDARLPVVNGPLIHILAVHFFGQGVGMVHKDVVVAHVVVAVYPEVEHTKFGGVVELKKAVAPRLRREDVTFAIGEVHDVVTEEVVARHEVRHQLADLALICTMYELWQLFGEVLAANEAEFEHQLVLIVLFLELDIGKNLVERTEVQAAVWREAAAHHLVVSREAGKYATHAGGGVGGVAKGIPLQHLADGLEVAFGRERGIGHGKVCQHKVVVCIDKDGAGIDHAVWQLLLGEVAHGGGQEVEELDEGSGRKHRTAIRQGAFTGLHHQYWQLGCSDLQGVEVQVLHLVLAVFQQRSGGIFFPEIIRRARVLTIHSGKNKFQGNRISIEAGFIHHSLVAFYNWRRIEPAFSQTQ